MRVTSLYCAANILSVPLDICISISVTFHFLGIPFGKQTLNRCVCLIGFQKEWIAITNRDERDGSKLVCRKVYSIFESRLRSHFWNCDLASQLLLELLFISILTEWPDKENIVIELYEIYNYIQARNISTLYLENCMSWLCSYMPVHFLGKNPHVCKLLRIHGFRRNTSCFVGVRKLLCHQVLPMFFFCT